MRIFELSLFFAWTVAARAYRDAKRGYPRETDFIETGEPDGTPTAVILDSPPNNNGNSGDHPEEPDPRRRVRLAAHECLLKNHTETRIDGIEARLGKAKAWAVSKTLRHRYRLRHILEPYRKVYENHRSKGFREPDRLMPRPLYILVMVVLGVSEFIFNLSAFESLAAGDLESLLIAAGLGLATPLGAHCFGATLRQASRDWRVVVMVVLMVVSFLSGMWFLAWIRQQFLLDQVVSLGVTLPNGIQKALVALLSVNLLIFVFSVGLAFFAHDPDRDLERTWRELKRCRRRMGKGWKRWSREAVRFNKLLACAKGKMDRLQDECITAINEYRDHNLRNRDDLGPSWFRSEVTRSIFCKRDFGALVEQQPVPLNEILENTNNRELLVRDAQDPNKANGEDKTVPLHHITEGDDHDEV